MSFLVRKIDISLRIAGANTIPGATGNTIALSGLRVTATITKADINLPTADVTIFGLPLDVMNAFSTLGVLPGFSNGNEITVQAGDAVNGMAVVFVGQIFEAYADLNQAPTSAFVIKARTGLLTDKTPVPPSSFKGSVDVATILSSIAGVAGYAFVNNGVTGVLTDSYSPGTALEQMRSVCEHADIRFSIDNHTLTIWPKYGNSGGAVPLLSANTGMVGYPRYSAGKIAVDCMFNFQVKQGTAVKIQSELKQTNGFWTVLSTQHRLESENPGGAWFTSIEAFLPDMYHNIQGITSKDGNSGTTAGASPG